MGGGRTLADGDDDLLLCLFLSLIRAYCAVQGVLLYGMWQGTISCSFGDEGMASLKIYTWSVFAVEKGPKYFMFAALEDPLTDESERPIGSVSERRRVCPLIPFSLSPPLYFCVSFLFSVFWENGEEEREGR